MLKLPTLGKRQKALEILGRLNLPESEALLLAQFDRLEAGQLPLTLWLDLFEAAAHRDTPALKARLAERQRRVADSPDPLLAYRECLEGGDADTGRDIFTKAPEAGCVRCHSVNGQGGQIGPELAGLGLRTDRIYILESIIFPDAATVLGYANTYFTLKNGETVAGLVHSESRDEITLISVVDGKRQQLKTGDIASRLALPSPMPPGFAQALTRRQLRDLVEFIATADPE